MIMKKYFSILCATLLLGACAKELAKDAQIEPVANNGVRFAAAFTKVSTDEGVNSWDANDELSIVSVVNGADPGVSAGTNLEYKTSEGGASVTFLPVGDAAPAGDKYYAYYKYAPTYPSAYNADSEIGFPGAAASAAVTDYRYVPVFINSGATVNFDTETGIAKCTNSYPSFYAVGVPPANEEDPVQLQFKPILPLLEFDLYGYGEYKSVVLTFTDKTTDAFAQKNWLSAKGVFNLATGEYRVTNYSNSAYHKLTVTLTEGSNPYVTLQGDKPMKFIVPVGFFNVTKGLTLTFTTKDGATIVKNIWANKIVCSYNSDYSPKHLRQGIKFAYVNASVASVAEFPTEGGTADAFTVTTNASWELKSKPEWISVSPTSGAEGATSVVLTASANDGAYREGNVVFAVPDGPECSVAVSQAKFEVPSAGFYNVNLSAIDFSDSFIYDVRNADDKLIARITREYLGSTEDVQVCVAYPAPSETPDYTDGLCLDNGGSVNAWTMTAASVVYTPGESSALTSLWVSNDGSQILTSEPAESVSPASVSPYRLASPTGQQHALVKIGSQIWTAEGYKTTKLANGTDIAQQTTAPYATSSNPSVIISDDKYLYNAHAVKANFAPAGWALPSVSQWSTDLASFLGSTTMYANLSMSKAQLYSRNTWKLNGTAIADLGYYNDWSNAASSSKWTMLMVKPDTAPTTSAQNMTAMFEVRLIKQ